MSLVVKPDMLGKMASSLKASLAQTGYETREGISSITKMFSAESLDASDKLVAEAKASSIDDAISNVMSDLRGDLGLSSESMTADQARSFDLGMQAAKMIAKIGTVSAYASAVAKRGVPEDAQVVTSESMGFASRSFSAESFSGQEYDNSLYYSIVFNFAVVRQEEAIELLFPTIVIDPRETAVVVEVAITSFLKNYTHSNTGSAVSLEGNKELVIKSLYSEKWLTAAHNKAVPYFNDDTKDYFYAPCVRKDVSGLEEIDTAPLALNKTYSLIALSGTPSLLDRGVMDRTDYLDNAIKLTAVYVKVKGRDANGVEVEEVIKVATGIYANANFMPAQQGNVRSYVLQFNTEDIVLDATTKTWSGAVSEVLSTALASNSIKVKVGMYATVDLQTGNYTPSPIAGGASIAKVYDSAGNQLVQGSPAYTAVTSTVSVVEIVGHDVDAYRVNDNARTAGVNLTSDVIKRAYQVPFLSDTTIDGPELNIGGDKNDLNTISSVVIATGSRQTMYGFKRLFTTDDELKLVSKNGITSATALQGVGSFYVDPYRNEFNINVNQSVDSMSSGDRRLDIAAMLKNKIRDEVVTALIESNYLVAFSALRPNEKIVVLIATDIKTKMYLTNGDGDTFNLTEDIVAKVAATPFKGMENTMFVTFGTETASKDGKIDPFNFGNTLWSPSIITEVNKQTNGANTRQISNVPRFVHIVNLPILLKFTFSDFETALGKTTKNVTVIGTIESTVNGIVETHENV